MMLASSLAHGHHVIGVPHYVVDSNYPEPILTLTEAVGSWSIELIHAPGTPDPDQPADVRFSVTDLAAEAELAQLVTVSVRRLPVLGPSIEVHGPIQVTPVDGRYDLQITYPAEGNYIVTLAFDDGDVQSDLAFAVVVGTPGRPWVTLAVFIIGVGILLIGIRAVKVKQARRSGHDA